MLGYTYAQVFNSKLYGFLFSVPIVYVGSELGALSAFLVSRYMFKDFIKDQIRSHSWLNNNFNMIDAILETEGVKVIALLRLTFAPFGVTSYILGVSSISVKSYMMGNSSYIINCCSQCFIGCSLFTATTNVDVKANDYTHLTFIVEILLTVIITIFIGYIAKNILENKLREQEAAQ